MIMLEPSNNKEMGILILVEEVLQDYTLEPTSYKLFIWVTWRCCGHVLHGYKGLSFEP